MLTHGEWRGQYPGRTTVGFHLTALYSPRVRWEEIVQEFLEVKTDPERLRVFINTALAEVWKESETVTDPTSLMSRREVYEAEVPMDVGILAAGVDVQDDRLELAVHGWRVGFESWLIAHHRICGDPVREEVWSLLEMLLTKAHQHEAGATLRIRSRAIDSGHHTESVYRFVAPRQRRRVYAVKGYAMPGRALVGRPGRPNRNRVTICPIGVNAAKGAISNRLAIQEPGPGDTHFCGQTDDGADDEYFAQLLAEKPVTKFRRGVPSREWVQIRRRNEALDLFVYALTALHILGAGVTEQLEKWVESVQKAGDSASTERPDDEEENEGGRRRRRSGRRNSWVCGPLRG
jgi:phage terminase large subunit GpA-like protein